MIKKIGKILLILLLLEGLTSGVLAQEQTGSIKGIVTDNTGNMLPGATVTVTSEALMGRQTYITKETGTFRFPALPPGIYTIVVEMPGFKTVSRENIIVMVGMSVTIDLTMEMSALKEELTVTAPSPAIDVKSTKIAVVMDKDILKNIPLARDLYDIFNASPGAVKEGTTSRTSVHGSTVRGNNYAFDGMNMNDPAVMYPLTNINFDVMEEVEIITSGHPAAVGYTDGAYVNVVTRSGGNKFSGGALLYYTNEGMNQHLWTDEQADALGVAKPSLDKSWIDGSLTLGGPIMKDRLWLFTNARYIKREQKTNFIGPWTDILGRTHSPYDWTHEETMGFIKLTSQLASNIKLMAMFNYVGIYRPMYDNPSSRTTFISTMVWDHEKTLTGNGILNYIINQNTFVDLRVGYVRRLFSVPMQKEAIGLPWIDDAGDLYGPLTSARYNAEYLRKRFQTGAYLNRFQDNFLGGNHEFKGGIEFEDAYFDYDWWRKDNMRWFMDSRNPNNYYFKDRGYLAFWICGPEKGSNKIIDRARRIGAYIQDTATFGQRLTVNVGIRFDRSWGWKPAVDKIASGNPISVFIGENIISPYIAANYPDRFPNGLNPWGDASSPEWKDIIIWNSWSPRIGLVYDIFGDGKTALKASYSRYNEYLMIQYFSSLHLFYPQNFAVFWYDTNVNGQPDTSDQYVPRPTDFRSMDPEFAKSRLNPDTTSPYTDEFLLGIWRELFKDFSLGVNFIYKNKRNILEDVLYSPDTDEYLYHADLAAAKKYWIPFTTTVPGSDGYPDQTVTFFVRSNDAPPTFYQLNNVPELKRKYWALEFIFKKRMANGWQFSGSFLYSKAYGNIGGFYGDTWGWSGAGNSPNSFINSYGRINLDRPLQIKLMGTVQLPYQFFLSFFYQFQSGEPWQRFISIQPPASWCAANNAYRAYYTVNIEPAGTRRGRFLNTLDLRLEKKFKIGNLGMLGAYIDIFNLLGFSSVSVGMNDGYRWDPDAEGPNQPGSKVLQSSYKILNSISGIRTLKVSLRYSF